MSLEDRLVKIRSSPKLQNQQQTAVVLNAIEDTLRSQNNDATPTAYFAALLSLLGQYASNEKGIDKKDLTYAVVYLLNLVTPFVPTSLLRSKFTQILRALAPTLTSAEAEAPLLRASIGCIEGLLLAQDSHAWALPQSENSPRRAVGGLLALATDSRPKVRKRALDALSNVLKHPPPSPSLDHPAADLCAQTGLLNLQAAAQEVNVKKRKQKNKEQKEHEPALLHALQLVKTIATAESGWPSKKLDALCEVLLNISKSSNHYLTMAAFEVFEIIFAGLAGEVSSAKLPRLRNAIMELRPSQSDTQLLPSWIAVLSRAYDVSAQVEPEETFASLPELFSTLSSFLASSAHNIRISSSECLISLLHNCVPNQVLLEPSIMDEKLLEQIGRTLQELLSITYQTAWMEVFTVLTAAFEALKWRSHPLLDNIVKTVGDLRSNESFAGKKEADSVLAAAVNAMGPEAVLAILPLNLAKPVAGQPGRAWLLPTMRDAVSNTNFSHFRAEMVPLSETMFQHILKHGNAEKTMDIKIFETIVSQIWACLPGYCQVPLDLQTTVDSHFAEMLSNLLYQQPQLRADISKALQNLVETNRAIADLEIEEDDLVRQGRVSRLEAKANLEHLSSLSANLLAVLFNVYSQTLPHNRGHLLQCINAYLSITPEEELMSTFQRVAGMLENTIAESQQQEKPSKQASSEEAKNRMPPTSHTLMDLIITLSIYLPRQSFAPLFNMAANIVNKQDDAQLQKKAYKLIPRLAECETGRQALQERTEDIQAFLLAAADKALPPAKRDRLASIAQVIPLLPRSDLHFIPSILSEVVISAKEVNDKARTAAFDLLVSMAGTMSEGGTVVNAKVPHMPPDAQPVSASLEEYLTMVSAGLAGSTPHMVSASITALTRLLYEFRAKLKDDTITDLVQTMDLFLTSKNREIVRSVLGFVKVCVISLSSDLMVPRLATMIPNLIVWSHEHKAHFKAKVKHIFERMIRRFGVETVEKYTPLEDRKLVANIRKTRDRRKRRKDDAEEDDDGQTDQHRRSKFESEYDEAVYGSESGSESDISDDEVLGRAVAKGQRASGSSKQYIVEDEDEPLDLLDRKALAHVSSTKPAKGHARSAMPQKKARTDLDGKLVFNEESDNDDMMDFDDTGLVNGKEPGDGTLEGGINAYVDAIKSKDAPQRGQRGKLKFKNTSGKNEDAMDLDEPDIKAFKVQAQNGRASRGGKGQNQRRPLGSAKVRGPDRGGGIRKTKRGGFRHGLQNRRR